MTLILPAISELAVTRPSSTAPVLVVAAWYERKAVLLHEIADTSTSRSEHDTFESFADKAHQHARRLRVEAA